MICLKRTGSILLRFGHIGLRLHREDWEGDLSCAVVAVGSFDSCFVKDLCRF